MGKINAIITGIGGYVPDYILNNEELSRMVDTNDEWIMARVGIKELRILTEEGAFAFDFEAACCGFLYSLDVAASMIQSGRYKRIVVIGADKMSSLVDYTDRATCVLFGDGAAAVLLEATEEENIGYQNSFLRTDRASVLTHESRWLCLSDFSVYGRPSSSLPLPRGTDGVPLCCDGHEQRRDESHGGQQPDGRRCEMGCAA